MGIRVSELKVSAKSGKSRGISLSFKKSRNLDKKSGKVRISKRTANRRKVIRIMLTILILTG